MGRYGLILCTIESYTNNLAIGINFDPIPAYQKIQNTKHIKQVHLLAPKRRARQFEHLTRDYKIQKVHVFEKEKRLRQCGHLTRASKNQKVNVFGKKAPAAMWTPREGF